MLVFGQGVLGVGEAEFEGRDEKEEGENFYFGHTQYFGIVHVEKEQGPDLGVDVLEDESEAFLRYHRRTTAGVKFDQGAGSK